MRDAGSEITLDPGPYKPRKM